MKLKYTVLFAILFATNANANILADLYLGGTIGVARQNIFIDGHTVSGNAQSYGAVLGLDIPLFRFEAEYNYINADENLNVGMLNAYVKLPGASLVPYFGGGVGTVFSGTYNESNIAYSGMIGITIDTEIMPFKFDIEGRALYSNDLFDNADLLHYEIRAKARYVF